MSAIAKEHVRRATIIVRADWDPEAGVWVATSDDIDGLAIEGDTLEQLQAKVVGAIEDLIELNGLEYDLPEIPVQIMAQSIAHVTNPARH